MTRILLLLAALSSWVPAARAQLRVPRHERDAIRVRTLATSGSSVESGRAAGIVDAPYAQVRRVVLDYARYDTFMPHFRTSRVLAQRGSRASVYMEVGILRDTITLWARLDVRAQEVDGKTVVEARMTQGNMDAFHARWELEPIDEGRRTLARFQILVDPDLPAVPDSVLASENAKSARRAIVRLRRRRAAHAPSEARRRPSSNAQDACESVVAAPGGPDVGEDEAVPFHDRAHLDRDRASEHRTGDHDGVELPVLSTRVHRRRKRVEQRVVVGASGEGDVEGPRVDAGKHRAKPSSHHLASEGSRVVSPKREDRVHPQPRQLSFPVRADVAEEQIAEDDMRDARAPKLFERGAHRALVCFVRTRRGDPDLRAPQRGRGELEVEQLFPHAVHRDPSEAVRHRRESADELELAGLLDSVRGHRAVFARAPRDDGLGARAHGIAR